MAQSPEILDRAAQELDLKHKWAKKYGTAGLSDANVRALLNNSLFVNRVPNTSIYNISVYSDDASDAAATANKIANVCMAFTPFTGQMKEDNFTAAITQLATPALHPARPNVPLNLCLGAIAGIILGLVAGVITLVVSIICRRVRAADNRQEKPDRFWRWFAVAVFALISIPFLIAIFGLLASIAIPAFVNARAQAQSNARQAAEILAPQNTASGATTNFYIGQTNFPLGDSIEITSVERSENQMTVKGHYHLVSHDRALLALYITTPNVIRVPTDATQQMQIAKGWGDFEFIDFHLVPGWPHVSMYPTNGEPFASLYFGTKAEALDESRANWITNTSRASAETSADADEVLAEQPPVVVETFPVSGAHDVEPGETEIRVRFSKEMADGSWSWSSAWENSTPDFIGQPHYETDGRTCAVKVKLEPGRTYAWWLNSEKFLNFRDSENRPAIPYLLIFQTKSWVGTTTNITSAEKVAELSAQRWLMSIDGGNYAESWNETSSFFRSVVTEPSWANSMNTFRQPLGGLVARKIKSAQPMTELPGAPDGQYVVMQFETSFANKKSAIETVTFMLEKDGQWKSAGYFIK